MSIIISPIVKGAMQSLYNFKIKAIDSKLKGLSPSAMMLLTTISLIVGKYFVNGIRSSLQPRWGEGWRENIGRMVLTIPAIQKAYDKKIEESLLHFKESVRKKWEPFGPLQTTLPQQGWSSEQLWEMLMKFNKIILETATTKNLSGTIYGLIYRHENLLEFIHQQLLAIPEKNDVGDLMYFTRLSQELSLLYVAAYSISYWWNALHLNEFPIGSCLDYQDVRMVGAMFGGKANDIMGSTTSGGTESLMLAIRCYRNWGMAAKGHKVGQGIILACKSVHAAVVKGGAAYLEKIVFIDTDDDNKMDVEKLRSALNTYGKDVVAIIASAPTFPEGKVDPIPEIAKLAHKYQCGLHVDCCLGAFVINNLQKFKKDNKLQTNYLAWDGVTSVSACTHKNGLAPKGSSILMTKPMPPIYSKIFKAIAYIMNWKLKTLGANLIKYGFYESVDLDMDPYGSKKDSGSEPCTPALTTYIALSAVGQQGYERAAKLIHETTLKLAKLISISFKGMLMLTGEPEVNVLALQLDPKYNIMEGGIYAFSEEMAKRNFILNNLKGDKVHLCVTLNLALNTKLDAEFLGAIHASLEAVKKENARLINEGKKFSGDAGIYCAIAEATEPTMATMSPGKYLENLLFGPLAAKETIEAYLLAQQNPFILEGEK